MFEIDPVAHLAGEVIPFVLEFHHFAATGLVVVLHGDLLADVLLGDAEGFLHAKLHGQTVRVPAALTSDVLAGEGLVAADDVLDGAGHHVVDAGHAVGGRRALKENETFVSLAGR